MDVILTSAYNGRDEQSIGARETLSPMHMRKFGIILLPVHHSEAGTAALIWQCTCATASATKSWLCQASSSRMSARIVCMLLCLGAMGACALCRCAAFWHGRSACRLCKKPREILLNAGRSAKSILKHEKIFRPARLRLNENNPDSRQNRHAASRRPTNDILMNVLSILPTSSCCKISSLALHA